MPDDRIVLKNVNVNNLKNINIQIPKNKIVVFTGVSGSGKSSLVFDTVAAESTRQMNKNYPMYLRRRMELIERPDAETMQNLTPSIVVNQKALGGGSRSTVDTVLDIAPLIRLLFSRSGEPNAGLASNYRRSDPQGMCPKCQGTGEIRELDEEALFNMDSSVAEDGINFQPIAGSWQKSIFVKSNLFDPHKPLKDFTEEEWENLLYGPEEDHVVEFYSQKTGQSFTEKYEGVIPRFKRLYLNRDISRLSEKVQAATESKLITEDCHKCGGTGFSQAVLESKINGLNIVDYSKMEMDQLAEALDSVEDELGQGIAGQVKSVVQAMIKAGIGYLSLDRQIDTLSGGERQRVKLVSNLSSSLNNMTYILDEPSAGLHPHDISGIKHLLEEIKSNHNSLLVVEHNRDIMAMADWVIDMGPEAGAAGGEIVHEGNYESLLDSDSLTAQYLKRPVNFSKRSTESFEEFFQVTNAQTHNLQGIDVAFPKGAFSMVTGVAGSGKSSLVEGDFMDAYPDAIMINQSSIGISSRSTPATYVDIMDKIRRLFADANDVDPGLFTFNSKGACLVCDGKGVLQPDVAFADPVTIICDNCQGTRFSEEARSYTYKDLSIIDVLQLTVADALEAFEDEKSICEKLQLLEDVGLHYLTLGQATSTLSGGELQRLKLASELQQVGNTYVLDEPLSGLHLADVDKLIDLIQLLVNKGNSVIVVDHHPSLMLAADWLVDLGPGAGKEGGNLLYQGVPKDIVNCQESLTGQYLKEIVDEES